MSRILVISSEIVMKMIISFSAQFLSALPACRRVILFKITAGRTGTGNPGVLLGNLR